MSNKTLLRILVGTFLASPLFAIKTQNIQHHTYDDFIEGTFENLTLSNEGTLSLGPAMEVFAELDTSLTWDMETDSDGNLLLGTGNDGKLLKVDSEGEVTVIFDSEELFVYDLEFNADGELFVATSPNGRIYRIAEGAYPEIYYDPPNEFIWDIEFDAEGGLFVATGAKAQLWRLPPDYEPGGEAVEWFSSDKPHFSSMSFAPDGSIYLGTNQGGYLIKVTAEGEGEIIFNASTEEISDVFVGNDGSVYFSTISTLGASGSSSKGPINMVNIMKSYYSYRPADDSGTSDGSTSKNRTLSYLYRVNNEGFVEPIWSPGPANIVSFAEWKGRSWIVGTDKEGLLFIVHDMTRWSLLRETPNGGAVSLIEPINEGEGGYYIITSNPAAIYKMSGESAESGTFTSEVLEATQQAHWGKVRSRGENLTEESITWKTRTGNTPVVGGDWNDWEAMRGHDIVSPSARYIQYEATFISDEAVIDGVRLFYTFKNAPPMVSSLSVIPVGIQIYNIKQTKTKLNVDLSRFSSSTGLETQKSKTKTTPSSSHYRVTNELGYASAGWKGMDPNGDDLFYDLEIKKVDDDDWLLVVESLEATAYSINTRGFQDGYYNLRVTVSDKASNPEPFALSTSKVSNRFLVDNSRPNVVLAKEVETNDAVVIFRAYDDFSIISDARYVLNGREAVNLLSDDLVFDSQEETFTVSIEGLEKGSNSLIFEVDDEMGNSGVAKVRF